MITRSLVVLATLVIIGTAFHADQKVAGEIALQREGNVIAVASFVSRYSDWPVLLAFFAATGLLAHLLRRADVVRAIGIVALGVLLSGVVATSLRSVTGRTRPSAEVEQGFYGVWHDGQCLIGKHKFNSFPSGHTAAAAGVFGSLLFLNWKLGVVGGLFSLAVGWSRLILQCHHFSDTVASTLIGLIAGYCAVHVLQPLIAKWLREKWLHMHPAQTSPMSSAPVAR